MSDAPDLSFFPSERALAVIDDQPEPVRARLHELRTLIIETAGALETVQRLEESVKWGEPSYRAVGGSPIRINAHAGASDKYALYVNCQTTLADSFRATFGDALNVDGSRAVVFEVAEGHDANAVRTCIELALTYHRKTKR